MFKIVFTVAVPLKLEPKVNTVMREENQNSYFYNMVSCFSDTYY